MYGPIIALIVCHLFCSFSPTFRGATKSQNWETNLVESLSYSSLEDAKDRVYSIGINQKYALCHQLLRTLPPTWNAENLAEQKRIFSLLHAAMETTLAETRVWDILSHVILCGLGYGASDQLAKTLKEQKASRYHLGNMLMEALTIIEAARWATIVLRESITFYAKGYKQLNEGKIGQLTQQQKLALRRSIYEELKNSFDSHLPMQGERIALAQNMLLLTEALSEEHKPQSRKPLLIGMGALLISLLSALAL